MVDSTPLTRLVENWREEAQEAHMAEESAAECQKCMTLNECARELEAALSGAALGDTPRLREARKCEACGRDLIPVEARHGCLYHEAYLLGQSDEALRASLAGQPDPLPDVFPAYGDDCNHTIGHHQFEGGNDSRFCRRDGMREDYAYHQPPSICRIEAATSE